MRYRNALSIGATALLLVLGTAVGAQAQQESSSSGFFIGVGLEGNGIVSNETGSSSTSESGAGGGLVLGYGFNPRWALYGQVSGAKINNDSGGDTYALAHVDFGTRVHFRSGPHKVVPFVQLGVSGRAIDEDVIVSSRTHTVEASGAGVAFGTGINVHFNPAVAFSAGVTWSVGNFSSYKVDNVSTPGDSLSATSARVHLGLVWFPSAH